MGRTMGFEQLVRQLRGWVGYDVAVLELRLRSDGTHAVTVDIGGYLQKVFVRDDGDVLLVIADRVIAHIEAEDLVAVDQSQGAFRILTSQAVLLIARAKPLERNPDLVRDDPQVVDYHFERIRDIAARCRQAQDTGQEPDSELLEQRRRGALAAGIPLPIVADTAGMTPRQVRRWLYKR